jgi:hypothetical protein
MKKKIKIASYVSKIVKDSRVYTEQSINQLVKY